MTMRDDQRAATRLHILDAAVDLLIREGYSSFTTVGVQRAAAVSRGALLHHFPTMRQLSEEVVEHLIEGNEAAVRSWMSRLSDTLDPVARAVAALYEVFSSPAFHAELELWTAARTDSELRNALLAAERRGGRDLRRVVDEIFGVDAVTLPNYPVVADMTIMLIRGLGVSQPLRESDRAARRLVDNWSTLAGRILAQDVAAFAHQV